MLLNIGNMSREEADCIETMSETLSTNASSTIFTGTGYSVTSAVSSMRGSENLHDDTHSKALAGQYALPARGVPVFPRPMARETIPSATYLGHPISSVSTVHHQHDTTTNFSDDRMIITRRPSRKLQDPEKALLSRTKYMKLKYRYLDMYITGQASKLELCNDLISLDVEMKNKYKELDFQALLDKNMMQRNMNCLTQTLGILEKYASNLIKPNRPAVWRTVKFTSSLVKTYLENVQGSHDILKQMGYTKPVTDGLSFPDDVTVPDVERIKVLAGELFLAKYEVDELIHDRHPYLHIHTAFSVGGGATSSSEAAISKVNVPRSEPVTSEDSESEYEDAEDGLSTVTESHTAVLSQNVPISQAADNVSATDELQCHVCGDQNPVKFSCAECKEHFCSGCVDAWHQNKKRHNHTLKDLTLSRAGDEKRRSSPSPVLHENATPRPVIQPRNQTTAAGLKKPVPAPRRRIPISTKPLEGGKSMPYIAARPRVVSTRPSVVPTRPSVIPTRQSVRDELPPPPLARRVTPDPTFSRSTQGETVAQQPSAQGEREVLRPPPFEYNYVPCSNPLPSDDNDEGLYESLKMPSEHNYEALDLNMGDEVPEENIPPPLPPPRSKPEKPSVSVCPHCFCLNEKDVIRCVACGTLVQEVQKTLPARSRLLTRDTEMLSDTSTINLPVQSLRKHFDLSPGSNVPSSPIAFGNQTYTSNIFGPSTTPSRLPGHSTLSGIAGSYSGFPGMVATKQRTSSTQKWECEHCTYHNDVGTNICVMCSRTSEKPVEVPSSNPISPSVPSYLKQQEEELCSYSPGSPISTPPVFARPQRKEEEQTRSWDFLQKMRESSEQIQRPQDTYLPPVVQDPPMSYQSNYTSVLQSSVYNPYAEIQQMKESGQEFIKLLKEAETLGFSPEELNIAYNLHQDDGESPILWLESEWFDRIHQVMNEFTKISKDDNIGNISPEEAREALIEHTGCVQEACKQCVTDRKKKLNEVMESGIYARTDIIKALDDNDGDVTEAIQQLQRMTFEPMLQRIKDSCIPDDDAVDNRQYMARQTSTTQDDEIFEAIVSNKDIDMDRRVRVMFAEQGFFSWGRALTAIKLIDMEFTVSNSIEAAKVNGDVERSIKFLQRECILCFETKPESHMVTMLHCQCRICTPCVTGFFENYIHDQNIMKLVCPACDEPKNLEDDAVANEYFNNLDIVIRRYVDPEIHDLFQRKLRDRTLMKEPNFRWCSHCSSGFINEQPEVLKMACPHCKKYTCYQCKKQWEDQHEGISCERFAAWKEANDPEAQANGLAAHLKQNGIECANCKFRYDLAKGGCMHFKCVQCSHEFCSGCYKPFRRTQHCPESPNCAVRGLHAHHPRDCLFYLRDRDPDELKKLLDEHNVEYNTEPPQRQAIGGDDDEEVQGAAAAANTGRCKVMEQKEGAGSKDVECGWETADGYAGLCRLHFIEYLVERINSSLIDPVGIFTTGGLQAVLRRNDLEPPAKAAREKDADYHNRIVQYVQEKLPLPRKSPRRRVLGEEEQQQPVMQVNDVRVVDLEQEDGPYLDHWEYDHNSIDYDSDIGYDNDSDAEHESYNG